MLWQYRSDLSGANIAAASQSIVNLYAQSGLPTNPPQLAAPKMATDTPLVVPNNKINYPIKYTWIRNIENWEPTDSLLASLAVPGYGK